MTRATSGFGEPHGRRSSVGKAQNKLVLEAHIMPALGSSAYGSIPPRDTLLVLGSVSIVAAPPWAPRTCHTIATPVCTYNTSLFAPECSLLPVDKKKTRSGRRKEPAPCKEAPSG
jgi:hypothetical protein